MDAGVSIIVMPAPCLTEESPADEFAMRYPC